MGSHVRPFIACAVRITNSISSWRVLPLQSKQFCSFSDVAKRIRQNTGVTGYKRGFSAKSVLQGIENWLVQPSPPFVKSATAEPSGLLTKCNGSGCYSHASFRRLKTRRASPDGPCWSKCFTSFIANNLRPENQPTEYPIRGKTRRRIRNSNTVKFMLWDLPLRI